MKNLQQLLKEIKKHTWWSEEAPGIHQTIEWAWYGFWECVKYFPQSPLSIDFFIYKNDFFYEETSVDEKLELFWLLAKKYEKNPKFIKKMYIQWKRICQQMLKDGWSLIEQLPTISQGMLAQKYARFTARERDSGRYAVLPEAVDVFTEEELPRLLQKELPKVSPTKRAQIAAILCAPRRLSFIEKYMMALLKGAKQVARYPKAVPDVAKRLSQRYVWIKTNYRNAPPKLPKDFEKEIKELIKKEGLAEIRRKSRKLKTKVSKLCKKQSQITKKYPLSLKLRHFLKMTQELGAWIDERKCVVMQATYILFRILEEAEQRLRVPARLLGYCTCQELARWLGEGKRVPLNVLSQRRKLSVFLVERVPGDWRAGARFITGPNASKIFKAILSVQGKREFRGTIASAPVPKVRGKISRVLDITRDHFVPKRILVTTMTRPEFLPFLRKAKAVITDEGGLTCHAAIVSRELGIPCIIGTKVATKVLKNGDVVEVDLNKGVVKKIK